MSSLHLRAAVAAAIATGGLLAAAPPSGAHTCAQVRVHAVVTEVGIPSCHPPDTPDHGCFHTIPDIVVLGAGVGLSACHQDL